MQIGRPLFKATAFSRLAPSISIGSLNHGVRAVMCGSADGSQASALTLRLIAARYGAGLCRLDTQQPTAPGLRVGYGQVCLWF